MIKRAVYSGSINVTVMVVMQDEQIVEIGKGVDELKEIANVARDEVKLQNTMLDSLQIRVDDVHEHVLNINANMKNVLNEVCSRSFQTCVGFHVTSFNFRPENLTRSSSIYSVACF